MKEKEVTKKILVNLPIFLFCLVFMSGYGMIFGQENSIVGVVILVGIIMFLKGDLGFSAKQGAAVIVGLFILLTVAPKVSLMNPFLGVIVNFVSIFIIMILSTYNMSMANYLTFMLGYLFCQGYDLSGHMYTKRNISLMLGAIIIAGLYYCINSKKQYKKTIIDVFQDISIKSQNTQWCLKLATILTLVMLLGELFNYPRTMWINLTILSIVTPTKEEHKMRRVYRIPATILGTLLFVILFQYLIPGEYQKLVLGVSGFGSMFMTSYFIKVIYNSFSALTSTVFVFSTYEAAMHRIVSNIIGVIIASCCCILFNKLFSKLDCSNMESTIEEVECI